MPSRIDKPARKKGFACSAAVRSTWPQSNAFVCKWAGTATNKTTTTTSLGNGLYTPSHVSGAPLSWFCCTLGLWPYESCGPKHFGLICYCCYCQSWLTCILRLAAHLRVLFACHFWAFAFATNRFRRLTVGVMVVTQALESSISKWLLSQFRATAKICQWFMASTSRKWLISEGGNKCWTYLGNFI